MTESPSSESPVPARLLTSEERETAVRRLTSAFTDDAIEVAEFERRVSAVYKAENAEALAALTRDLPDAPGAAASDVPASRDRAGAVAPRPRSRRIASLFSSVERRVGGPLPEVLHLRSVMGSLEVDLRDAEFPPGTTEIRVRAIMARVEIELPDHVRVENDGKAFMGRFAVQGRRRDAPRSGGDPGAPVVRITGRSIMSGVEVETDD